MIVNLIIKFVEFIYSMISIVVNMYRYFFVEDKRIVGKGKTLRVVLNGPSVRNIRFSDAENTEYLFVNRGFMHQNYSHLNVRWHIFIDPKLLDGTWPFSWFGDISGKKLQVVFPSHWKRKSLLRQAISDYNIEPFWHRIQGYNNLGVGGEAIKFGIIQGYERIEVFGFDANGIAYEMIKKDSHWYGKNEENISKNSVDFSKDLFMHSKHLRDLNRLAIFAKRRNTVVRKMTVGGILDMFD